MNISLSKTAAKALSRQDTDTKKRIVEAINGLPFGDVKKLKGYTSRFRLRVGDWRVLFELGPNEIQIKNILPRGDAYKK